MSWGSPRTPTRGRGSPRRQRSTPHFTEPRAPISPVGSEIRSLRREVTAMRGQNQQFLDHVRSMLADEEGFQDQPARGGVLRGARRRRGEQHPGSPHSYYAARLQSAAAAPAIDALRLESMRGQRVWLARGRRDAFTPR